MNVVIVGSVATDTITTPSGSVTAALGGSATYASVAASYFARPGIVGVVGGDFANRHLSLLRRHQIDLEGLQIDRTGKTFHWKGYYEGDMNQAHTIATELNVFENFNPVIPDSYRKAPFLMLGNIHPSLQLEVLKQMRKPRLVLCDTMNFWITSEPKLVEQVFRRVDVISINDGEAFQFCKTKSLPVAAAKLLKLGPSRVIIKKGVHGVLMFGKNSFFGLPAMPLKKVQDPTGAGDSFAGGLIGSLARSRSLSETSFRRGLVAGTTMASFCVEKFSLRATAALQPRQINQRARQLRDYTSLPAGKLL